MTLKIRKRTVFFFIGIVVLVFYILQKMNIDGVSVMSSNAESYILPGTMTRDFSLFDTIRLLNYRFELIFNDYPWVVKTSLVVIVGSIITTIVTLIQIYRTYSRMNRVAREQQRFSDKYYGRLHTLVTSEHEFTATEIQELFEFPEDYRANTLKEAELWFSLYMRLHEELGENVYRNHDNMLRASEMIGLVDYGQRVMLTGTVSQQNRILQIARLTRLPVSEGALSRLLNHQNRNLRRSARLLYMMVNTNNPYNFMSDNTQLTVWERMELHALLRLQKRERRSMPAFLSFIKSANNPSYESFLIRESAFWDEEKNGDAILKYLSSPHLSVRMAVIDAMAIRNYGLGIRPLQELYSQASVVEKHKILQALFYIHEGRMEDFFVTAYRTADAYRIKIVALDCLHQYSHSGRELFDTLREAATEQESILFKHVLSNSKFAPQEYQISSYY